MIISLVSQPLLLLPVLAAIIIAFTVHEFSHALVADRLGDPTPKSLGRLTLNPLAHMHPIGFLLLITAGVGFGKPVPFNEGYLKNPKWGGALIGLAGPLSNLLLAILGIAALVMLAGRGLGASSPLYLFLLVLVQFNVALLVFNLLPIPPLDGSKLVFALIPDAQSHIKDWLENYGPTLLLLLIIFDVASPVSVLGRLFQAVLTGIESFVLAFVRLS